MTQITSGMIYHCQNIRVKITRAWHNHITALTILLKHHQYSPTEANISRPPPARLNAMSYTSLSWAISWVFTCPNTCRHKLQAVQGFATLTTQHQWLIYRSDCEMRHSHSSAAEDPVFWNFALSFCKQFSMFRSIWCLHVQEQTVQKYPEDECFTVLQNIINYSPVTSQKACTFRSICIMTATKQESQAGTNQFKNNAHTTWQWHTKR